MRAHVLLVLALLSGCGEEVLRPSSSRSLRSPAIEALAADALASSPSRTSLLRAASSDALVTLHLPDMRRSRVRMAETAFAELLSAQELGMATAMMRMMLQQMLAPPRPGGGRPLDDVERLLGALSGELLICLETIELDEAGNPVGCTLFAGTSVTGAEAEAGRLVDALLKLAAEQPHTEVTRRSRGGVEVGRVTEAGSPMSFELAVCRDVLLVGLGRGSVGSAVERICAEGQPSLADHSTYVEALRRCRGADADLRLYVSIGGLIDRFAPSMPADGRKVLAALGIDRIRSFATAARIEGGQVVVRSFLDSPGGRDVFTRYAAAHPVDPGLLARVPASVGSVSLCSVDGPWILSELLEALPEAGRRELEEALAGAAAEGFDLVEDVIEVFGPTCAMLDFGEAPRLGSGAQMMVDQFRSLAFLVEVRDAARAEKVLARLPEPEPPVRRRKHRIGDTAAVSYDVPIPMAPGTGLSVSFAIHDGFLAMTLAEESLRRLIEVGGSSAADTFRELLAEVPERPASLSLDTMRKGPGLYFNGVLQAMAMARQRKGPASGSAGAFLDRVRELGPALAYTRASDDGTVGYTRSPTGTLSGMGGVVGIAIVAAIAIPNLLEARVSANESATIATLASIHNAQTFHQARAAKDRDGDGDGEFGFLAELVDPVDGQPLLRGFAGQDGLVTRSGYYYRTYLPAADGSAIAEDDHDELRRLVDPNLAEKLVVVVAWPVTRGKTGRRAFFMDAEGSIYACERGSYGGDEAPPPDLTSEARGRIGIDSLRRTRRARDGNVWVLVQ